MAPPPPTAPLSAIPLPELSEFSSPLAFHGGFSPKKHTTYPDTAATISSKLYVQSSDQYVSASPTTPPPPALAHMDSNLPSASSYDSPFPHTILPPLSWAIKPLTVRVPSPPLSPCAQPSPTSDPPAHNAVSASLPPSSRLATRHHPPLLRHLVDRSLPPPSCVDWPQFISNAASAAERPVATAAERRRLSTPAAAHHHYYPASSFRVVDTSTGLSTGAHNVENGPRLAAAENAPNGGGAPHPVTSHTSPAESDPIGTRGHGDMQKTCNFKRVALATSSTDAPTTGASPQNEVRASRRRREGTLLGPLLHHLLTPQTGAHCPVHAGPKDEQHVQQWRRPTVLLPPFFSSPAALQRSENTLQSELASSVLRCRAAELRQQRLLQLAAAVIHQAVRVHASRIVDIIEMHGTAVASASVAALPVEVPGMRVKPGRRPGTVAENGSWMTKASSREIDNKVTFTTRYYDWLCGPAELNSCCSSSERGVLQCLPVIVAPAGADVADHRLAVHGLLRECVRRCHRDSSVGSQTAADCTSQRYSMFLRLAVIRPSHCSSVGKAMRAIYEQITQIRLSSGASPAERSGVEVVGRSSRSQQEAPVQKSGSWRSSRSPLHSDRRATVHSSANHNLHAGNNGLSVCYDGGAAAAWGENAWISRRGADVFSAGDDASLFSCFEAGQYDEVEVAAELQQLSGTDMWGAAAGASDVGLLLRQEEFWEIENRAEAAVVLGACHAEQSTWGDAHRRSCHHTISQGQTRKRDSQRQTQSVHQQQYRELQQQRARQGQPDAEQQRRDYGASQQPVGCNNLLFLSGTSCSGTARSYVRRSGESDNLCEKLACWWAAQQQQLLQRSSERCSDGGIAAAAAAAAPASVPSRRRTCKQSRGEKCASRAVPARAASTHLRSSPAAGGNIPPALFETQCDGDDTRQHERTLERSTEEGKRENREKDAAEEVATADEESNDEQDLHTDTQVLLGTRGEIAATAAAPPAAPSPGWNRNSRVNSMQPAAIVIVFEEAEAFPGGLLARLLQLLALLRQQLSLPFIVVATASTNATVLQQLCDSPLSSSCCVTVEPATLLQPARVQQQLLQLLLCCPAALPFTLPLAVAEKLLQSIEETSPSVLQLLRRLQLVLRLFYQHHPLAFLCRDLDGVAALMEPQYETYASTAAAHRQQQQQYSSSSIIAAYAAAARCPRSSYERPLPGGANEEEEARPKKEETQEQKSSTTTQDQQLLQHNAAHNNSRDAGEPAYDSAAGQAKTASTAPKDLDGDLARELHALHVVKQLRRRVELLAFASLTGDHVHMLRQLLRHTNEVFIHLTAAQQEGLFFFDRCCWQQVRLQRQHQRRTLLAAAAAASNGAAFSCSSSLLRPLQRDAAASTLALRCRPEEDGEQQKQQQQCSKLSESGGGAAAAGIPLLETVGGAASAAEDYTRRKAQWGCHRLAGCVARRSTLGLLQSWWGGRGLLLLQKVEEEEKQQKLQQQQEQVEQKHVPSASTATGFNQATRGGDTQGDLLPLKLKLLCKEVLPAASIELLQRRVGYCMAYRLLFVLQQQLQRYRRLASAAATDAEAAATAGNCGGGFAGAAGAKQWAGNVNLPGGGNNNQQQEAAGAEEEELLLRIAAEEEVNSNCRQTIETLDLLVGAHEEFSCLLRKCKPRARVQEMAKACFAVEQDVRRVVVSLFEQFAVAAPVRVSAAVAATHTPEPLADPAALVLPLKLFRAQVKREARLLRVLAAAEDVQQRREQQLACADDSASSVDAAASAASHAPVQEQACELQQQQLPFSNQASTHASEVVRVLDTLDALICDLSKAAAAPAVPAPDPATAEAAAAAAADCATPRGVEQRTLSAACKPETASSGVPANSQRRGGRETHNDICSNKKEVQGARATAGQHRLAGSSSLGAGLTISAAAARQKRRQTQEAADALRALFSLKRKFVRWVEEALLLLLLPLPGWHPLGGELAVWGGALGFEVAAAVQFPREAGADPAAAAGCPRLFDSFAGNTDSASQKRYRAGTLSGTLAAAADLVCSSFEAAPQTETLQHAAMGSTSFLQRFNVPLEEEREEEEGEEAYAVQAPPQQQKQKRHLQLQQLSQRQEEASLQLRTEAYRQVRKGKGTEERGDRTEQQEEEIKLEDVAIVLRLVNGAGRRINLWDLFCAFCRDLLKNRIKKKKAEIQKKLQRGTYGEKGGKVQCSWPDNVSSNSSSPQPGSSTDSVSQKWSSQRQKKRQTRISESDVEEEVLRLMEAESCSLHADTAERFTNSGLTSGPPHPKECQNAPKNLTGEDSQRQKAASSRIVQADLLYAKRTSHVSRSPVGTPRGTPVSHSVAASASPAADASTIVRVSRAAGAIFAADSLSAVRTQLPGSMGGERVPWTLLQQLQLRFAVAIETLDQQLGVIRLPSAASAAAAVERVMLAEEGGEDAAVIPDLSVIPPGEEQAPGGDEVSRLLADEIEESEEDASEAEAGEEGEFLAATNAEVGTEQEKRKCIEACKAGGARVQDENTNQPGTRCSRAVRSSRSNRRGLAVCEREKKAASPCQRQRGDTDDNVVSLGGDDVLLHELRTMRKLLRNVFARRTHFVSISSCSAEESGDGTVESGGSNVERYSDKEMEERSSRKKSCTSRRKSNRRSRKKVLL